MWNIFKRKKNKKYLRELNTLSTQFAILDEFARRGMIYWKSQDDILLIEESLSVIQLAAGKEKFQHFLEQVSAWQNYRLIAEAYENRRMDIETAAVRKAQADNRNLTKADIYRIRQLARSTMPEIGLDSLNVIKEFDIMIIRATAVSAKEATEENGQLLAIGHYDGKQVEMIMYDDIKQTLHTGE